MKNIIEDKVTAKKDEGFVVFLIGMRINYFWKIHKWFPIFLSFPKMVTELIKNQSLGYLGGETWFGRNIISIQYWESFEKLEHFARSKDLSHLPEWQKFLKKVGTNDDVMIEMINKKHSGVNPGESVTKFIVFYMGTEDLKNTIFY